MKHQSNQSVIRALQGAIAAFGAPLGWILIRYFSGVDIFEDIAVHLGAYSYMLLGSVLTFSCFGYFVGNKEQQISELALHDALTGLFNVRYFRERLNQEILEAKRSGNSLSLILFDLDHFKKVNDKYGHSVGDDVLVEVSNAALKVMRKHEVVARVGGEEFVALLPNCKLENARHTAERLRQQIAASKTILVNGKTVEVTVSLGVTEATLQDDDKSIYQKADEALYLAKANGRNRVVEFTQCDE